MRNRVILHPGNRQVMTLEGVRDEDGDLVSVLDLVVRLYSRYHVQLGDDFPVLAVEGTPGMFRCTLDIDEETHGDAVLLELSGSWMEAPVYLEAPVSISSRDIVVE